MYMCTFTSLPPHTHTHTHTHTHACARIAHKKTRIINSPYLNFEEDFVE